MKKLIAILAVAFVAACPTRLVAQTNLDNDPAYLGIDKAFDLKTIKPEVNINLPKFLLKDALADFDGGKNDPFASAGVNIAELTQDIKLIRVVVMESNKTNSEAIAKGIANLKSTLEQKWTSIALVGDGDDKVGIYAIGDPTGNSIAGLAVMIHEGKGGDAVIANIVGRVSLGKIVKIASQMDKFPKDLLKKLSAAGEAGNSEKPKEKSEAPAK